MLRYKKWLCVVGVFAVLGMTYCHGLDNKVVQAAEKLMVTRKDATAPVRVGTGFSLKVTMSESIDEPVQWISKNEKYATVSKKGVVTAKKAGIGKTVTIVAKTEEARGTIRLTILPKINPKKKMIAITYDDGPRYSNTKKILCAIKKYKAVATFFTLGSNLKSAANRKILKQSFSYGNEIANHTMNHRKLSRLSTGCAHREIQTSDRRIYKILGFTPKLFRPPYGAMPLSPKKVTKKPYILWSIDTWDWKTRNANSTYHTIMRQAKDGAIVLMHDIHDATANAADRVFRGLKKRGYQFVTVDELYRYRERKLKPGKRYSGIK